MNRINDIRALDINAIAQAKNRWNSIAKPLHSLGKFEEIIIKIAGITGEADVKLNKKCVVVMCADNGVVKEGVTQSGAEVTRIVAEAMVNGDGNINNLCKSFGADVIVIDAGMLSTKSEDAFHRNIVSNNMICIKVKNGTNNIAEGPAMSYSDCEAIISSSINIVEHLKAQGYHMIATGEMGIGNTTTSSAIASVILGKRAEEVTGRGAGLSNEALLRKISVIEQAIKVNRPDQNNPLDILSKLGGYDIAGMTGLFLGGAIYHVPIVVDGFISLVAAAIAKMFSTHSVDYMIQSHISKEPAAKWMMEYLNLEPVITADMCLGEGTGAVMMFPLLMGALDIYHSVHSFEKLEIEQYKELK